MPFNLLETVKNHFTNDFVSNASTQLGESTSAVSKALTAIIPISLAGILNKATSGTEGANEVFNNAKNAADTVNSSALLSSNENIERGNNVVNNLFASNQSTIPETVSHYAGIKPSSGSNLMSMAMPAIMGILGKHAEENNLSASGLAGYLSSQKDRIVQALPSGLSSLGTTLGLDSVKTDAMHIASDSKPADHQIHPHQVTTISERPTAKWLVPLIAIVIVVLLLWYFSRGCGETKPTTEAQKDSTAMLMTAPSQPNTVNASTIWVS